MYKKQVFTIISTIIFTWFFTAVPVFAANVFQPVCANWSNSGTPPSTCSGGVLTFASGTGESFTSAGYWLSGNTIYLSFTYTGTGSVLFSDDGVHNVNFSSSQTDYVYTAHANGSLDFASNNSFAGTLSNICVTDTIGGCAPTPSSGSKIEFPFPGKEASTTYSLIDYPNFDYFMGIVSYFACLFLVILIFKRK